MVKEYPNDFGIFPRPVPGLGVPVVRPLGDEEIIDYGDRIEHLKDGTIEVTQFLGEKEGEHLSHQLGMEGRIQCVRLDKDSAYVKTPDGEEKLNGSDKELVESFFSAETTTEFGSLGSSMATDGGTPTPPKGEEISGLKKWGKYILLGIAGLGGIGAAAVATSPQVKDNFEQAYNTLELDKVGSFLTDSDWTHDPKPAGNYTDFDDDGLTRGKEIQIGTDPMKKDSDGDGHSDKAELVMGTDPTKPNTYEDFDNDMDGVLRNIEMKYNTNDHRLDTDNDGWGDRIEIKKKETDPTKFDTNCNYIPDSIDPNPADMSLKKNCTLSGPDGDPDGDSLSNLEEFVIMNDDDLLMQNKIDPTVDDKKYMVRYKDFIILAPENWTIYRQKGIEGLKVMEETFPEGYNFLDKYTKIITPVKKSYHDIAGTQSQRYTLARNGMGIIGEKNKNHPPSIERVLHETVHLSCYTLNFTDEQIKRMKKYKASEAWDEISAYDASYRAAIARGGPSAIEFNGNISKTIEDVFDQEHYPGHTDLSTGDIEKLRNSDIYEEINKQRGLNIFQR